jgi:hypothetical protein
MTHFTPGLILEALLVVLLLMTVGYCVVLNGRLGRLRSSQHELRQIVSDLTLATTNAETAIRGLRTTTEDAEAKLSDKLHKAQLLARELSTYTNATARPAPAEIGEPAALAALPRAVPSLAESSVKLDAGYLDALKRGANSAPKPRQVSPKIATGDAPGTAAAPPPESAAPTTSPAIPPVDRDAWRRHALSRLKRAS